MNRIYAAFFFLVAVAYIGIGVAVLTLNFELGFPKYLQTLFGVAAVGYGCLRLYRTYKIYTAPDDEHPLS